MLSKLSDELAMWQSGIGFLEKIPEQKVIIKSEYSWQLAVAT